MFTSVLAELHELKDDPASKSNHSSRKISTARGLATDVKIDLNEKFGDNTNSTDHFDDIGDAADLLSNLQSDEDLDEGRDFYALFCTSKLFIILIIIFINPIKR